MYAPTSQCSVNRRISCRRTRGATISAGSSSMMAPHGPLAGVLRSAKMPSSIASSAGVNGASVGLLDACTERRHVVHGDLLYQNVLVSEDASAVTGVFSWKHSIRGDFLWDTAYCTYFSAWYPDIGSADPRTATLATSTREQRLERRGAPPLLRAHHRCAPPR